MRRPILCLLLLLALALPGASAPAGDPVSQVLRFYCRLNDRDWKGAYAMRSASYRQQTSLSAFRQNWQSSLGVGLYDKPRLVTKDGSAAVVEYKIGSCDEIAGKRLRYGVYDMRARLTRVSGVWYLGPIEAKELNVEEGPSSDSVRANRPVPPLPQGVPVPQGFQMGEPVAMKLPATGEVEYVRKARRRVPGVEPETVGQWYLDQMPKRGWQTTSGLAGGASCLGVGFKKGDWVLNVLVRNTTWEGTEAPIDPRGTTLELRFQKK